ncbi:hypothetical protein LNP25_32370 [Klebsiella variicola subsp. variicola]|nr:hypothetical protein [Klebsiella variicola subsp. variicola]
MTSGRCSGSDRRATGQKTLKKVGPKPGWLETGASVFPVLAIVLIVAFVYL